MHDINVKFSFNLPTNTSSVVLHLVSMSCAFHHSLAYNFYICNVYLALNIRIVKEIFIGFPKGHMHSTDSKVSLRDEV